MPWFSNADWVPPQMMVEVEPGLAAPTVERLDVQDRGQWCAACRSEVGGEVRASAGYCSVCGAEL